MSFIPQMFKLNDPLETKMVNAFLPFLNATVGTALDAFYQGAYESYGLGGVLYDTDRDPVASAISRDVYLFSYPAIHQLFTRPGTFEYYLTVFRAIWGESVAITFDVPNAGHLTIDIEAQLAEREGFLARRIVGGTTYTYDRVLTHEGALLFDGFGGVKTQQETDILILELQPVGIFVEATLTVI